jgi:AraC-like DNA-binding protein
VFSLHEDLGLSGKEVRALFAGHPLKATKEIMTIFGDIALLWAGKAAGYELRCAGLLTDLIGRLVEESKEFDLGARIPNYSKVKKAIGLLEGPKPSIAGIAGSVGLSESRFRHVFKEATGYSPTRYANIQKIRKARDLLSSGEYNVTEAAEALGFEDIFYFSRLFKSIMGQNASTFLRK